MLLLRRAASPISLAAVSLAPYTHPQEVLDVIGRRDRLPADIARSVLQATSHAVDTFTREFTMESRDVAETQQSISTDDLIRVNAESNTSRFHEAAIRLFERSRDNHGSERLEVVPFDRSERSALPVIDWLFEDVTHFSPDRVAVRKRWGRARCVGSQKSGSLTVHEPAPKATATVSAESATNAWVRMLLGVPEMRASGCGEIHRSLPESWPG